MTAGVALAGSAVTVRAARRCVVGQADVADRQFVGLGPGLQQAAEPVAEFDGADEPFRMIRCLGRAEHRGDLGVGERWLAGAGAAGVLLVHQCPSVVHAAEGGHADRLGRSAAAARAWS